MRRDFRRQATQLRRVRAKYVVSATMVVLGLVAAMALFTIKSFSASPATRQATVSKLSAVATSASTDTSAVQPFFHTARPDRSGAVIHDMLLAHAYAFAQNRPYGGACAMQPLFHMEQHLQLIEAIGLSHLLPFACPKNPSAISKMLEESKLYLNRHLWTSDWLRYIRGQQNIAPSPPKNNIAVHIRRGDVSLCNPETKDRYLVNQHYLYALLPYQDVSTNVTIFSESLSTEPWQDFAGATVLLDTSPSDAWRAMMKAKVLVLSKSSFSIVPALFNTNTVVYTPFWVDPLPEWKVVDDDAVRTAARAAIRLRHELCTVEGVDPV